MRELKKPWLVYSEHVINEDPARKVLIFYKILITYVLYVYTDNVASYSAAEIETFVQTHTFSSFFFHCSSRFVINSIQWERTCITPAVVALNVIDSPRKSMAVGDVFIKDAMLEGVGVAESSSRFSKGFINNTNIKILHLGTI